MGLAYGACADAGAANPDRITFVIDPTGTVQEVIAKVDVKTHPKDILARI